MIQKVNKINLTWDDCDFATLHNVEMIGDKNSFKAIIIPLRGGLVYAGILAYYANLDLPTICIRKNEELILSEGKYLFLDDINDTSKSFLEFQSIQRENVELDFLPMFERRTSKVKTKCQNIIQHNNYVTFPWDHEE